MGTNSALYTATDWSAVTPSDTVAISPPNPRALYIGAGGNVAVVSKGGTTATFACAPNQTLLVAASRVASTGTTASLIVALY